MCTVSWKAPEHILQMPETRHQRVRKRLHILTEGDEIPPPVKTFKVSHHSSFHACYVAVRHSLANRHRYLIHRTIDFEIPVPDIPISTKIRLMKALVWPVATYGCESWTLRKNEETRLDAFEMKGLKKIVRVSWTAKKTNG